MFLVSHGCPLKEMKLREKLTQDMSTLIFWGNSAKNIVISPDFLVWKFCGNAQFPHSFGNSCAFLQNFHTRKSGEITIFFPVLNYAICRGFFGKLCARFKLFVESSSTVTQYHSKKSFEYGSFSILCFTKFWLDIGI